MAELIAQERVAVVNAASVDAKVATPVPPAENKAKDAAKKGVDVKPSFYDQVCSYDGFDSTSDWNQNLDLNAFSLDPLIKQYKAYKSSHI